MLYLFSIVDVVGSDAIDGFMGDVVVLKKKRVQWMNQDKNSKGCVKD